MPSICSVGIGMMDDGAGRRESQRHPMQRCLMAGLKGLKKHKSEDMPLGPHNCSSFGSSFHLGSMASNSWPQSHGLNGPPKERFWEACQEQAGTPRVSSLSCTGCRLLQDKVQKIKSLKQQIAAVHSDTGKLKEAHIWQATASVACCGQLSPPVLGACGVRAAEAFLGEVDAARVEGRPARGWSGACRWTQIQAFWTLIRGKRRKKSERKIAPQSRLFFKPKESVPLRDLLFPKQMHVWRYKGTFLRPLCLHNWICSGHGYITDIYKNTHSIAWPHAVHPLILSSLIYLLWVRSCKVTESFLPGRWKKERLAPILVPWHHGRTIDNATG